MRTTLEAKVYLNMRRMQEKALVFIHQHIENDPKISTTFNIVLDDDYDAIQHLKYGEPMQKDRKHWIPLGQVRARDCAFC